MNEYDLSGKTLIPFNTNGGYGVGSSFDDVRKLAPDAEILPGFAIEGGLEKEGIFLAIKGERQVEVRSEVRKWLRRIGVLVGHGTEIPANLFKARPELPFIHS